MVGVAGGWPRGWRGRGEGEDAYLLPSLSPSSMKVCSRECAESKRSSMAASLMLSLLLLLLLLSKSVDTLDQLNCRAEYNGNKIVTAYWCHISSIERKGHR